MDSLHTLCGHLVISGSTPIQYLTRLRMQIAMDCLSKTTDKIKIVAENVGHKDAYRFPKAFKKVVGLPPKEFRKLELESRDSAFRIGTMRIQD